MNKPFVAILKSPPFFEPKAFLLHKPFFTIPSNPFLPSIFHSHPAITYCPPKNDAVLVISALNPYAVTPEPRTDSKPFRRRFVRKTGFGSCCRKLLQNHFRQSFESRSQDGVPRAFYVTFCTTQKVTTRSLCREHRGFANLESAYPNNNSALTKLKPFPKEIRGFPNLESAHQNNNFPRTKLKPFETFRFAESLSLPGRHTPCAFFAACGGALLLPQQFLPLRGLKNTPDGHPRRA